MDKYIVVTATDRDKLVEKVNKKIEEGYMPQGGMCREFHVSTYYHQAMVLQEFYLDVENMVER